jgi:hypothetical protein
MILILDGDPVYFLCHIAIPVIRVPGGLVPYPPAKLGPTSATTTNFYFNQRSTIQPISGFYSLQIVKPLNADLMLGHIDVLLYF